MHEHGAHNVECCNVIIYRVLLRRRLFIQLYNVCVPNRLSILKLISIAMLSALVLAFIFVIVSAGVAPGDEEAALCKHLRAHGVAPTPAYSTNVRVLMDFWNYRTILDRPGAVWDQVDNDMNNDQSLTTNVILYRKTIIF